MRLVHLLSTVSGVLLLPAGYLSAMSGFCMREPGLAGLLTLGLLGEYGLCSYIHLEAVPLVLVVLAFIHTLAALEAAEAKVAGARPYRLAYTVYKLLAWVLAAQVLAVALVYSMV